LKAAGKTAEAAELEKRVRMLDTADGTLEKVQAAMQSGKQAMQERRIDDAEKSFKEAVGLAEHLPPGNENLIVALGVLGNAYGMGQDYSDADATFHRELAVIEKTFGVASPRTTDPLRFLGEMALGTGNVTAGEGYFQRALDVNLKAYGENSGPTTESLRRMALVYRVQKKWDKAEPYLLRAVKSSEIAAGPESNDVLVPLYGLCDLYDRWGKPEKSQPCWHRVTEIAEKLAGEKSPDLSTSLTSEANALRKLGRKDEAEQLEERLRKIHRAAQTN
jgi:tetratricopeptide (TPR) repeat protein